MNGTPVLQKGDAVVLAMPTGTRGVKSATAIQTAFEQRGVKVLHIVYQENLPGPYIMSIIRGV